MSGEQTREDVEGSTTIEVPDRLVSRIETRLPATDFDSSDEYVAYVLEEVLAEIETDEETEDAKRDVDEEEVRTRLESLGYIE